jgi:acetyl esterase/lipase
MRLKILLSAILVLTLAACNTATATPTATATLIPSPLPSPTPAFDASRFGTSALDVTYCTMDGTPVKMDVYYPASGGPWPVFLYVHGGGWNKGDKAEGAGWSYLNAHGYLVISLNYRLADYNVKFPAMIQDVKCAVRYLRAHAWEYNLDPEHIGALGASAGGHLVALLGTSDPGAGWDVGEYADQSSRVQAVVAEAVFSDFTQPMPNSIATAIYFALGALPGMKNPTTQAASPVTYISPDDPPFLIIHGEKDGYAPLTQAEELNQMLLAAGVNSSLIIVHNGEHSLQGASGQPTDPTQEQIAVSIFEFLDANLK